MAVQIKQESDSESESGGYIDLTGEKPMFMKPSVEDELEKVKSSTTISIRQVPEVKGSTCQDLLDITKVEPAEDPISSEQNLEFPQATNTRKRTRKARNRSTSQSSDEQEVLKKISRTSPTDFKLFQKYFAKRWSKDGLVIGGRSYMLRPTETNPEQIVRSDIGRVVLPFSASLQPNKTNDKGNEPEAPNTTFPKAKTSRGSRSTSTANASKSISKSTSNKPIDVESSTAAHGDRPKAMRSSSKTMTGKNRPKDSGNKHSTKRIRTKKPSPTYANDSCLKSTPNEAMDGKSFSDIVKGKNGRSDLPQSQTACSGLAHLQSRNTLHRSDLPEPLFEMFNRTKHPTEHQKEKFYPILVYELLKVSHLQAQSCTDRGTSLRLQKEVLLQPGTNKNSDVISHSIAKRSPPSVSTTPLSQGLPDLYKLEITDSDGTLAEPNEDQKPKGKNTARLKLSKFLQRKGSNN
ncbi:uncharacterized protein LOC128240835 [Mya arenaria]|uniref:uncharacterized protein LOC128240835 n=1 Tax=Mya arenaria TaxID=6604 RepID=UPI0022E69BEF|nr:uncharacterized protein LOC128240835 [Mya arenaria]